MPKVIRSEEQKEYDRKRSQIRHDAWRSQGLCGQCGRKRKRGRKSCPACIKKAGARRTRWRKAGLCVDCRKPSKTRRCPEHQEAHQKYKRKRAADAE
jgi:ribosomal protein L13E